MPIPEEIPEIFVFPPLFLSFSIFFFFFLAWDSPGLLHSIPLFSLKFVKNLEFLIFFLHSAWALEQGKALIFSHLMGLIFPHPMGLIFPHPTGFISSLKWERNSGSYHGFPWINALGIQR